MSFATFRNKSIGLKLEAAAGTRETIAAGDYGLECTDIVASATPESIEKNVFRGSISGSPARIGKVAASVQLGGELKNSGVAGVIPRLDAVLQAARMLPEDVKSIAVTVTTGSITRGVSVIKGGTSNATGLALALEEGVLYYVPRSGTFQTGETITSGTFAATSSGTPQTGKGYLYSPCSSPASEKCLSLDVNDGGLLKQVYGAASTLSLSLSTSEYPKWAATLSAVAVPETWGSKYEAPSEDIWYEGQAPALVVDAKLRIGATYAPVTQSVQLDLGNSVALVENLNKASWYEHALVTQRQGTGSLSILADLDQSASLYAALFAGQTASLEFQIGTRSGTQIDILCPAVQYAGIAESDSNSLLAQTVQLKLTGSDNELLLWFR